MELSLAGIERLQQDFANGAEGRVIRRQAPGYSRDPMDFSISAAGRY